MSADTESTTGAPDYGDALVAALGFEPTDALSEAELEETVLAESGPHVAAHSVDDAHTAADDNTGPDPVITPTPTDEVDESPMAAKKGKGKGPNTFAATSNAAAEDDASADPGPGVAGTELGDDPSPTDSNSPGSSWLVKGGSSSESVAATGVDASEAMSSTPDLGDTTARVRRRTVAEAATITGPIANERPAAAAASAASTASSAIDSVAAGVSVTAATLPADPDVVPAGDTLQVEPPIALPDTESSGVKPVTVQADLGTPVVNGLVAETAAAPTGAVRVTPVAEAPGTPSSPPLGPPLVEQVGVQQTVQPGVALRQPTQTESVGDKMSDLAAKVPQLLDGGLFQRSRRVRARKVRRVVRHIDPWSVLTFSVLFHLCVFAALLLSSVLVWNAAVAAGTIENIESFIRELGDYTTYEIKGDVVFRAAMVIAGILTLASSVLMVLLTVVFNLISDLVGGIRLTVVEEETVRVRRKRNQ